MKSAFTALPGRCFCVFRPSSFAGAVNGTMDVNLLPFLIISRSVQYIKLSWPLWATNVVLQVANDAFPGFDADERFGTVGISNIRNEENVITLPIAAP
jgi:hypothetical protein